MVLGGANQPGRPVVATKTALFTDLESSTTLWDRYPEVMASVIPEHQTLIATLLTEAGGQVVCFMGDGVYAVFDRPRPALRASIAIARKMRSTSWPVVGPLGLRIGLHHGECYEDGSETVGPAVNLAARLCAAARPGQILTTSETVDALTRTEGLLLEDLGRFRLNGIARPIPVVMVSAPDWPPVHRPIRARRFAVDNQLLLTSRLIGRDDLLVKARASVRRQPLTTLVGPGGVGKSVCARHLADTTLLDDGVVLVDCSSVDDRSLDDHLISSLNLPVAEEDLGLTLARYVDQRQLLLILDGCDHLLAPIRVLLGPLLGGSGQAHVLLTSREPLRHRDERVIRVDPLPIPPPGSDLAELLASPAVALFAERALAVDPLFRVDADNVEMVAGLCRALDGLPQAIGLAAGRLDVEPVHALAQDAERLLDRLGPATGDRTDSIRASLHWTLEHLSGLERDIFLALSSFEGPFHRDTAIQLAGAGDTGAAHQALDRLLRVNLVSTHDGGGRLQLSRLVRQFGRELAAERSRDDHAELMLNRGRAYATRLMREDQIKVTALLELEFPDLRQAFERLVERDRLGQAAEMVVALFQFGLTVLRPEVFAWARQMAARLPVNHDLGPELWGASALGSWFEGDIWRAIELGEAVVASPTPEHRRIWARTALVNARSFIGAPVADDFLALVSACKAHTEPYWRVNGWGFEALGLTAIKETAAARQAALEALSIARRLGNPDCMQWALHCLAQVELATESGDAQVSFSSALHHARQAGCHWSICLNLIPLAGLARLAGDPLAARAALLELAELLSGVRNGALLAHLFRETAFQALEADDAATAAVLYQASFNRPAIPLGPSGHGDGGPLALQLDAALGGHLPGGKSRAMAATDLDLIRLCQETLANS